MGPHTLETRLGTEAHTVLPYVKSYEGESKEKLDR